MTDFQIGVNAAFIGKWTLASSSDYWSLNDDKSIGIKTVSAPQAAQLLNGYGQADDAFWLQASNWSYLVYDAGQGTYMATEPRIGQPAVFALVTVGNNLAVTETASNGQVYYVVRDNNKLTRSPKSSEAPSTAQYQKTDIAPGLAEIQAQKVAFAKNLSGAWLENADLRRVNFASSDLTDARLKKANLAHCIFQGTTLTGADLSSSDLSDAVLSDVIGNRAVLDGVTMNSGTNLCGGTFNNASFRYIVGGSGAPCMNNITAEGALFDHSDFSHVPFNQARLKGASLVEVVLKGAQMGNTDFSDAVMTQIRCEGASLQACKFDKATLAGADFSGADLTHSTFVGANLTNANLAKVAGLTEIDISGALLIGAKLQKLDLTSVTLNSATNFTQANMEEVNLTQHNLSGNVFLHANLRKAKLDHTTMNNAVLVDADISFATFEGNVSLIGANLSNARMESTTLTGAQFGALQSVGMLDSADSAALDAGQVPATLTTLLANNPDSKKSAQPLKVLVREPSQHWRLENDEQTYLVQRHAQGLRLLRAEATAGAVLSNAFMANANLKEANLYAVDMSGVQWYGVNARADQANLEQVNLSNANISSMNFTQAQLYGANLSFSNMVLADFTGAKLTPTQGNKATTLAFSSVQGACFLQAQLGAANLTNAAVGLTVTESATSMAGDKQPFTLDTNSIQYLDQGFLNQDLVDIFAAHNIQTRTNDCLIVVSLGSLWVLRPSAQNTFSQYIIVLPNQGTALEVYGMPVTSSATQISVPPLTAVPLFQLDAILAADLNNAQLSQTLTSAFTDNGYPLIAAAATAVIKNDMRWAIRNIDSDPYAIQHGYGQFRLYCPTPGDPIRVYGGSPLIVMRRNNENSYQKVNIAFGPTQFDPISLTDVTVTPSGLNYSMRDKLTYEQLMTAGLPPKPPTCIPSLTEWC